MFLGRKILITGGTKGLGLATARLFAKEGCSDIFLSYRSDESSAIQALQAIQAIGSSSSSSSPIRCHLLKCDLSYEDSANQLFTMVEQQTDHLDYYIHNAAATAFKPLLDLQSHHIDKTFNITIKSFILGMKRLIPLMAKNNEGQGGGAIVTISGMDTLRAVDRHGLLGAAKSALQTLTSYYAHELGRAPYHIRVNCVNPGFFETDSTKKLLGPAFQHVSEQFSKAIPMSSSSSSPSPSSENKHNNDGDNINSKCIDDIAKVIAFLCSDQSRWLVGQTLYPDGGWQFAMPPINSPSSTIGKK